MKPSMGSFAIAGKLHSSFEGVYVGSVCVVCGELAKGIHNIMIILPNVASVWQEVHPLASFPLVRVVLSTSCSHPELDLPTRKGESMVLVSLKLGFLISPCRRGKRRGAKGKTSGILRKGRREVLEAQTCTTGDAPKLCNCCYSGLSPLGQGDLTCGCRGGGRYPRFFGLYATRPRDSADCVWPWRVGGA